MRLTKNRDSIPVLAVGLITYVKFDTFVKCLVEYFWNRNELLPSTLTKADGCAILRKQLVWHGLAGEDMTRYEGASDEAVQGYNANLPRAEAWVLKYFPHLKQ